MCIVEVVCIVSLPSKVLTYGRYYLNVFLLDGLIDHLQFLQALFLLYRIYVVKNCESRSGQTNVQLTLGVLLLFTMQPV